MAQAPSQKQNLGSRDASDAAVSEYNCVPKDEALNKTGIFYHESMTLHKCEDLDHVERPERISVSYQELNRYGLLKKCKAYSCKELDLKTIEYSHPKSHIDMILRGYDPTSKNGAPNDLTPGEYDSDTFYNQHTPKASLLAAGGFYECLEKVCITREIDNGFALVRPPGHHACEKEAMGFCHFNNVVVGINGIKKNYGNNENCPKKVLIVDWDVHHGNGTQDMTYNDGEILYFSTHRYFGFYPGTGAVTDTGGTKDNDKKKKKKKEKGKGKNNNEEKKNGDEISAEGKNINVTLSGGMGDYEYQLIWRDILIPVAKEFAPDLIVISAGFDACTGDPLGGMRITPPCYGHLTKQLMEIQSKVVILLEGGYNLESMPKAVCCCVHALLTVKNDANANADTGSDEKENKENDKNDKNDKNNSKDDTANKDKTKVSLESNYPCEKKLLFLNSTQDWKEKTQPGFALSNIKKREYTGKEIRILEQSFGYLNGCLQCINEWSDKKDDVFEFHRAWMNHVWIDYGDDYDSDTVVIKVGKNNDKNNNGYQVSYKSQYPSSANIISIIESVMAQHEKYWPSLKALYKSYKDAPQKGNADFVAMMQSFSQMSLGH